MSSDIRIKLSDFDAELLANIAEREGRTPEAVVLRGPARTLLRKA